MSFKDIINDYKNNLRFKREEYIYPVSKNNLSPILILIENSFLQGSDIDVNVEEVSISPTLWLDDFLEKYIDNISYVSKAPIFEIYNYDFKNILVGNYECKRVLLNDDELNELFNENKWKSLVFYSLIKKLDLKTMEKYYILRYADITEDYEIRDNKINEILNS
jgi:hypothetical protein